MRGIIALVALAVAASACSAQASDAGRPIKAQEAASTSPAPETPSASPTELPDVVMPEPDGTYTHSCDYVLGDFTAYTQSGYRFIADAQLHNTGNVGTVNKVDAVWFLAGGGKVTMTKTVKVKPGKRARVGMTKPVGSDEIDLHQSLGYDSKRCNVKVAMIDTFGDVAE